MSENPEDPNASQECKHEHTITPDPESGEAFCAKCGLLQEFENPVPIGSRLIPPREFLRRVAANVRMIDSEILWRQQRKHELLSAAADFEMFAAPGQTARALR